jgi:hypothetical protein
VPGLFLIAVGSYVTAVTWATAAAHGKVMLGGPAGPTAVIGGFSVLCVPTEDLWYHKCGRRVYTPLGGIILGFALVSGLVFWGLLQFA